MSSINIKTCLVPYAGILHRERLTKCLYIWISIAALVCFCFGEVRVFIDDFCLCDQVTVGIMLKTGLKVANQISSQGAATHRKSLTS